MTPDNQRLQTDEPSDKPVSVFAAKPGLRPGSGSCLLAPTAVLSPKLFSDGSPLIRDPLCGMGQYVQVRLAPYEDRHVDPVFQAVRESIAEVSRWMWWCHSGYSLAESEIWVRNSAESFRMKTSFEFVVESHDGQVLGCCGLNALDPINQRCNLGYWTRTSAANRGVATEAVSALVDWAFRETKLVRLEIIAAVGNSASRRVAEKSNAYEEGILRSRLLVHGRFHDAAIYSIVKGKPHAA